VEIKLKAVARHRQNHRKAAAKTYRGVESKVAVKIESVMAWRLCWYDEEDQCNLAVMACGERKAEKRIWRRRISSSLSA
jgi:hypothetical protein